MDVVSKGNLYVQCRDNTLMTSTGLQNQPYMRRRDKNFDEMRSVMSLSSGREFKPRAGGHFAIAVDFPHWTSVDCQSGLSFARRQQQVASSYWAGGGRKNIFLLRLSKAEILSLRGMVRLEWELAWNRLIPCRRGEVWARRSKDDNQTSRLISVKEAIRGILQTNLAITLWLCGIVVKALESEL